MITFVNRNEELELLENKYNSNNFELIVIYGRRRIGKTELVKRFIKDKDSIYYLCRETTPIDNIRSFKEVSNDIINLDHIKDDWEAIFKYISEKINKKLVIVLDEFPYLIKSEPTTVSIFQRIVDLYLKYTKIKLILLGSSISIIEKDVLSYNSPLYGRITAQLKIKPLKFKHCVELLQKDIENSIKIYGICGGVPLYLKEFVDKKDFWDLIKTKVLSPTSILREDAIFLLSQEFREPSKYFSILEAISLGKKTLGEIISFSGFKDKTSISPYINRLLFLEIIEKIKPILTKNPKKGLYEIKDEYLRFYFRYIYPNLSLIEEDVFDIPRIKKDYNSYLGRVFEKICKEIIIELMKSSKLPMTTKIGPYWDKNVEIDLLALNESSKKLLAIECKWKDNIDPKKICKSLIDKLDYVQWYNNDRKEYLCIFAKSFKEKINEFEGYKVFCYDLKDIEKIVNLKS